MCGTLVAAAYLLVALVPSTQFRQCYRTARPHREAVLTPEGQAVLHQVYTVLLRLLKNARLYTDISQHGSGKLSAYFTLLNYFAISRTEKLMVSIRLDNKIKLMFFEQLILVSCISFTTTASLCFCLVCKLIGCK